MKQWYALYVLLYFNKDSLFGNYLYSIIPLKSLQPTWWSGSNRRLLAFDFQAKFRALIKKMDAQRFASSQMGTQIPAGTDIVFKRSQIYGYH